MEKDTDQSPVKQEKNHWARAAVLGVSVASFFAASSLQKHVREATKEVPSKLFTPLESDSLLKSFAKGLASLFDPKLWRSNLTFWGANLAGSVGGAILIAHIYKRPKPTETLPAAEWKNLSPVDEKPALQKSWTAAEHARSETSQTQQLQK